MKTPTLKDLLKGQKDLPALDTDPIKKLFKPDEMPSVDESQAGWMNLHTALAKKYGPGYAQIPGVKTALAHYKKESDFLKLYKRTVGARYGKSS